MKNFQALLKVTKSSGVKSDTFTHDQLNALKS